MKELRKILPQRIYEILPKFGLEEIRIRENQPLKIRKNNKIAALGDVLIRHEDICNILECATENSMQSYMENIKNGFITIKNGHRIGICGEVIYENDKILNFKRITSLNIRVAKKEAYFGNLDLEKISGENLLIISPPNYGKTTLLRKIITFLSEKNYNVSVVDERYEITQGFNLGDNIDIIYGANKVVGANMVLKTMSPDYIICDEITNNTEILQNICDCGVKVVATIHGKSIEDICKKRGDIMVYFDKCIEIKFLNNERKYVVKGIEHD